MTFYTAQFFNLEKIKALNIEKPVLVIVDEDYNEDYDGNPTDYYPIFHVYSTDNIFTKDDYYVEFEESSFTNIVKSFRYYKDVATGKGEELFNKLEKFCKPGEYSKTTLFRCLV